MGTRPCAIGKSCVEWKAQQAFGLQHTCLASIRMQTHVFGQQHMYLDGDLCIWTTGPALFRKKPTRATHMTDF